MIEAGLEYKNNTLENILHAFASLPLGLKPLYFASDERDVGGRGSLIEDQERFSAFVKRNKAGFFLSAPRISYSIRLAVNKPIICDCFLEVDSTMLFEFLARMAAANPVFGFACVPEERRLRNRVTVEMGANIIESWVGRDTKKYLPGLYWLTLISEALARLHHVSIEELVKNAHEHVMVRPGNEYLFQFYQEPQDWLVNKRKIDTIYASSPGIFDIEKVRPAAMAASTGAELLSILGDWN
jgi:hypothetical protein